LTSGDAARGADDEGMIVFSSVAHPGVDETPDFGRDNRTSAASSPPNRRASRTPSVFFFSRRKRGAPRLAPFALAF
jgi:hypothetical protein